MPGIDAGGPGHWHCICYIGRRGPCHGRDRMANMQSFKTMNDTTLRRLAQNVYFVRVTIVVGWIAMVTLLLSVLGLILGGWAH